MGSRSVRDEPHGRIPYDTLIDIRIRRLAYGNAGDVKPVGAGISELRLDHGPGYRVYFIRRAPMWIVLLAGSDKSTQERDIRIAKRNADGL
jgi:putative addiction module killer protein